MSEHHGHNENNQGHGHNENHKHYILSYKGGIIVWIALLALTVLTVAVAQVHLGPFNFLVAAIIATVKAALVAFIFMGLIADTNENRIIFFSSLIFCAIFFVLTITDIFFRAEDSRVIAGAPTTEKAGGGGIQVKYFWKKSDEVLAHGKEQYNALCFSCHGIEGKGDGPAAGAFNPPPRNFAQGSGWTKGRKVTDVYETLSKGLNMMPPFGTLPPDTRFALAQYVLSFGPAYPEATDADLRKAGIDPSKPDGGLGGAVVKEIPVDLAVKILSEEK